MLSLYGITGLSEDPQLTGGLTSQAINGYSALGRQATNPQFQNPIVWNPKVNYSWIMKRHALKAGYEYQMIRTQVEDINPLYGRDTYNSSFSRPTCAQLGQPATCTVANDAASYGVADFLFGCRLFARIRHFGQVFFIHHEGELLVLNFDPTDGVLCSLLAGCGNLCSLNPSNPKSNRWFVC
jgi:hypothetical protein